MRTFSYDICGRAVAKHIFTCNRDEMQVEASELWAGIQKEVELTKENACKMFSFLHVSFLFNIAFYQAPYFSYICKASHQDVSPSLSQAMDFMSHCIRFYGEEESADIKSICCYGWITAGSRKVSLSYT